MKYQPSLPVPAIICFCVEFLKTYVLYKQCSCLQKITHSALEYVLITFAFFMIVISRSSALYMRQSARLISLFEENMLFIHLWMEPSFCGFQMKPSTATVHGRKHLLTSDPRDLCVWGAWANYLLMCWLLYRVRSGLVLLYLINQTHCYSLSADDVKRVNILRKRSALLNRMLCVT